jgi:cytochrome c peroxidase
MALTWDREFNKYVRLYAEDEKLFFADFAKAFQKLEENGVNFAKAPSNKPWYQFW